MTTDQLSFDHVLPTAGLARVDVDHGPAGLEQLGRILDLTKDTDPLAPVTVLAPSNIAGVTVRRHLGRRAGGVVGLQVLTTRRLGELLGGPGLTTRGLLPASTPLVAAAVRLALADAPGVFAAVADHPATLESLVRVHGELRDVAEPQLDELATASVRAADVVRLHREVRRRLAERFHDEADLLDAATAAVPTSAVVPELGHVVLLWPQRLSLAAAALVRAVAERQPVSVLVAWTGHADADRDVVRVCGRVGLDATPPETVSGTPGGSRRVVTASDQDEEVRHAVELVVGAVHDGVAAGRIALLHPADEPYARLLGDAVEAAGLPVNGPGPRSLADHHVGRWVLDLLDQVGGAHDRVAVMALLAATVAPDDPTYPGAFASWMQATRRAGVVAGSTQWAERLERELTRRRERGHSTRSVEGLQSAVDDLFRTLHRLEEAPTWETLAAACRVAVTDWLGHPEERTWWPTDEREAAERVEAALDRLAVLDLVEEQVQVEDFRRTLELELAGVRPRRGRLGDGVLVAPLAEAVGLDLDLVVVVGLAEGVLPSSPRQDSLLLDHERALVAADLPPRRHRVGTQRRQLLAALASAPAQVLLAPRGDLRTNAERVRSRWLEELVAPDDVEASPSFGHRVTASRRPASATDARIRALAHLDASGLPGCDVVTGDVALRRGVEIVTARRHAAFSRFDGNVGAAAHLLPGRAGDALVSATALESWVGCPHGALVEQVLRVRAVENPEERLTLSPMEVGNLVHKVLERWVEEHLDAPPAPHEPWSDTARARLQVIADEEFANAEATGLTGHEVLWSRDRDRLRRELDRFVDHDDVRRAELGVHPVGVEVAIGEDTPPVEIRLDDGRVVRFRGFVDRVDRTLDGRHVVTDYKTGRAYAEHKAIGREGEDPVAAGTRLQLAVYALGIGGADARDVRADYWFVSQRAGWERHGYVVDDQVVDRLRDVVQRQVAMWDAGMFVPRPDPPDDGRPFVSCHVCDPDGLGTADLHRRWEQLVVLDDLAPYVDLLTSWEAPT